MTRIEFLKALEGLINRYDFDCCLIILTNPSKEKLQLVRVNAGTKADDATLDLFDNIQSVVLREHKLKNVPSHYYKDFNQPDTN